ncbi:MAG: hypothetical protein ACOCRZ_06680 [Halothermotrichaceae bacterium]
MPRRSIGRGLLPRQRNLPVNQLPSAFQQPRIAEVFEDLATEVAVELVVYENFLDLNPQVRNFPNVDPPGVITPTVENIYNDISPDNSGSTANTNSRNNSEIRRDVLGRQRGRRRR